MNTRRVWNQHAYSVTNVNENGTIPAHPVPNWLTTGLNTFRSNSQGSGSTSPFAAADLIVTDLDTNCITEEQTVSVNARVKNQGSAAASGGLKIAFYLGDPASGGILLDVATFAGSLAPGESRLAAIVINAPPGGTGEIFVVADDDGSGVGRELECREDNNVMSAMVNLGCDTCFSVSLNDYNLFLLEDYNLGRTWRARSPPVATSP